jgi:hypothetical protein
VDLNIQEYLRVRNGSFFFRCGCARHSKPTGPDHRIPVCRILLLGTKSACRRRSQSSRVHDRRMILRYVKRRELLTSFRRVFLVAMPCYDLSTVHTYLNSCGRWSLQLARPRMHSNSLVIVRSSLPKRLPCRYSSVSHYIYAWFVQFHTSLQLRCERSAQVNGDKFATIRIQATWEIAVGAAHITRLFEDGIATNVIDESKRSLGFLLDSSLMKVKRPRKRWRYH